jgi:cellulose synthase/poly-beta-1,6-N-acetylglucosamine synthase-like glycosyltransferase
MNRLPGRNEHVAVVIIGRNEGGQLALCLESVLAVRALGMPMDIIYVDSASTDGSPELAEKMGAHVIRVSGQPMTAARGRNAGWTTTQAPFVLFLDGDTVLHPLFLDHALSALKDPESGPQTAAVWGHRRESNPGGSVYNRVLDLDWIYPAGWTEFFGGDVLIRREALVSVDGYNPELIAGEEPEMCRRLREKGWRILHIDEPMTRHDLRMTHFSQYWRRATRCGHAYAQVSGLFENTPDPFWTAEARRNRKRGLLLFLLLMASAVFCVLLRSGWPLAFLILPIFGVGIRSAWKARSRSNSWATLLLFGLHSHLQEIPIFIGQMRYRFARARRRKVSLIEYKRA